MPRTLISTAIRVYNLVVDLAEDATVQHLYANADVTYDIEQRREQVDLLPSLTATERTRLDALVARLLGKVNVDYLA